MVEGKQREDVEGNEGGWLKRRLKGVQKRKPAQRGFECEAVAPKMRLMKVKEDSDR